MRYPPRFLALLVALSCLWGPSFMINKLLLRDIGPVTLAFLRIFPAGLLLLAVAVAWRWPLPQGRRWMDVIVMALLHSAVPFALIAYGQTHIDSALASILNGTVPIFTIFVAQVFLPEEGFTLNRIVGIGLGFCGIVAFVAPGLVGGVSASVIGSLAVAGGALCYAGANVYSRIRLKGSGTLGIAAVQLLVASALLFPAAFALEGFAGVDRLDLSDMAGIGYISVGGTAIAVMLFYSIVMHTSASFASMVTYLIPAIAIGLGVVFLDERLDWNHILGGVCILLGVMVVNNVFAPRQSRRTPEDKGLDTKNASAVSSKP